MRRYLLTSTGLVNDPIKQAFLDLLPKPAKDITVAFIPTAKNLNTNDKRYFMRVLLSLDELGVKKIDFVDIDAIKKEYWLPRLEAADVIYVGGGNTYYLLNSIRNSGLISELPRLLESRLYVGDSAGGIVITPSIDIAAVDDGDENIIGIKDTKGLGLIGFEVSPHTPEDVSIKGNKEYSKTSPNAIYAFDDHSAIKVNGSKIEQIGNGHWSFNNLDLQ